MCPGPTPNRQLIGSAAHAHQRQSAEVDPSSQVRVAPPFSDCLPSPRRALGRNLIFSLTTVMRAADWKHAEVRGMKGWAVHGGRDRQRPARLSGAFLTREEEEELQRVFICRLQYSKYLFRVYVCLLCQVKPNTLHSKYLHVLLKAGLKIECQSQKYTSVATILHTSSSSSTLSFNCCWRPKRCITATLRTTRWVDYLPSGNKGYPGLSLAIIDGWCDFRSVKGFFCCRWTTAVFHLRKHRQKSPD